MKLDNITKEELLLAINNSNGYTQILKKFGINYINGRVRKEIDSIANRFGFDVKKFRPNYKYDRIVIKCPTCGNDIKTVSGGKGKRKYCNYSCAAKYSNAHRILPPLSGDFRKKLSETMKLYYKLHPRNKTIYKRFCECCKSKIVTTKKTKRFCSNSCSVEFTHKSKEYKEKMRNIQLKKVENGTHKGWKSRKKLVPSYPEKYFMKVLDGKFIKYEFEKPCGKYFIDFAIEDVKIALEIDGKQHNDLDRRNSDIQKDEFLKQSGWKVFRIKWKNPINELNKKILYSQIDEFDKFYQGIGK